MDFLNNNLIESFFSLIKTFKISDFLDIIIVAFIIYSFIKLVRETRAEQLVKGIIFLIILYIVSYQISLKMLSGLLNNLFQFSVIALLVVFQPELRRALEQIGRSKFSSYWNKIMSNDSTSFYDKIKSSIDQVIDTCMLFSQTRTGALIIFERKTKLRDIIDTGTVVDANVSVPLLGNIFFNKSPLHDGAMVIRDGRIHAAGCILPLTKNENVSLELGTRHRAALGMSELSDAICLIVSEETGSISITRNGIIVRDFEKDELKNYLYKEILVHPKNSDKKQLILSLKTSIKNKINKRKDKKTS